jgi:type II secretory pathway pseudopilin PulG
MSSQVHRSARSKAFTLMELLFVMVILVGLAALMAGAIGPAKKRIARSRTEGLIKMLETGLEQYHATYGIYPINPDPEEGAKILYHSLFGDYDCNGKPDWLEDTSGKSNDVKTFVNQLQPPELDASGNPVGNNIFVQKNGDHYEVVDAWGEPVYYVNYKPKTNQDAPLGGGKHNAKYDLWSIGNDPDPSDDNTTMWIKNW